jgi:hypothetical protein
MIKKALAILFVAISVLSLVACGGSKTTEETSSPETSSPQESSLETTEEGVNADTLKISIEDIAWTIEENIVDGDRYVVLNYTNNSQYTVSGFVITFSQKDGITNEDISKYFTEIQEKYDFSDDDIAELKQKEITMYSDTDKVVEPGASATNINCYYYSGYTYLKDINHFNLVEPDIATIRYVDGDAIYTVYYDFKSGKYSFDDETVVAYQWSANELGGKIPKPDVKIVEAGRDDETIFMFKAYGTSLQQFNAYVEECISQGYTIDPGSFEGFYSADNKDGYNVYLHYEEDDNCMSGTVKSPE